jgi:transposase, IS5 family
LQGRCDSFVVETDVHYPTDTNLLWDAMRKVINGVGQACEKEGVSGWRQYRYNLRQVRKRLIRIQKARYSNSKDESKKARRKQVVHGLYRDYLSLSQEIISKAESTLDELAMHDCMGCIVEIDHYIGHARRQMDQIERRVLKGEVIPHEEKVFSIFEPHTEWVSKGKAGVPVELGVRVCVLEDQHQFLLHHRIMWKETDDKVAVAMVEAAQQRYPDLRQCSFDKGFYTPENLSELNQRLDHTILPKKGRLNKEDQAHEQTEHFRKARFQRVCNLDCVNAV